MADFPLKANVVAKANTLIVTDVNRIASVTVESDALAVATTANWLNVTSWRRTIDPSESRNTPNVPSLYAAVKEFDLEITCDTDSETITSPALYGCRLLPVTIADDAVDTVDFTNNELDVNGHLYQTGDGPVQLTTTDTLPTGLALATNYYVRDIGANSIQLHTSRAGAVADTGQVTFSDVGTGTHTIVDVQSSANSDNDTKRFHFCLYGDINAGNTITVGVQTGYIERIQHDPLTLYYSVLGTSGTGAQTCTIRAIPVQTVEW